MCGCAHGEGAHTARPEAARRGDELAPALLVLVGRTAAVRPQQLVQPPPAAGRQSSRRFQTSAIVPPGRRTRAISASAGSGSNQWKAWPTATASTLASASGSASAVAGHDLRGGREPGEHRPHLGERLDRDHPRAGLEQRPRQLAGAGREVDDDAPRSEREPARRNAIASARIAGPGPLVELRHGAKRVGRRMDLPRRPAL